jgi:asparagine synthase (glutamine-hydrolysing)
VAISGIGGDELLAGYPSFIDLPRWRRRFGAAAAIPGLGHVVRELTRRVAPHFADRYPKVLGLFQYASSWGGVYLLRRGIFLPDELSPILDPALVKEGLRRLQPLRALAATIKPDPRSNNGRVLVLEASHYMRNQLLRDADWAGMAHSIEIRVPLVDVALLKSLAAVVPVLKPGMGKAALARAPSVPLPDEVIARAKSGFWVPIGDWMEAAAHGAPEAMQHRARSRGIASRQWSRFVLAAPEFALSEANAA